MKNIISLLEPLSSVISAMDQNAERDPAGVLDELNLQLENAQAMARNSPDVFLRAAMNIASMDFFSVFNRFDVTALTKRLEEKPELFFTLINSYTSLMRANLEREKFEFKQKQAEAKHRERARKLRARKPILVTEATLHNVTRALSFSRQQAEHPISPSVSSANHEPSPSRIPRVEPASTSASSGFTDLIEFTSLLSWVEPKTTYPEDVIASGAVDEAPTRPPTWALRPR